MTAFLPAGMLEFREALARAAKVLVPETWSAAKQDERNWLDEGSEAGGFRQTLYTRPESVAGKAYAAVRPALAEGTLPASMRSQSGAPEPIEAAFWTSKNSGRLSRLVTGDILIREVDLEAMLKGEPAPGHQNETPRTATKVPERIKRGRPSNPDADSFWIEAARKAFVGDRLDPLATFVADMVAWCDAHMAAPYDEETVRKKLSRLVRELKRRDIA